MGPTGCPETSLRNHYFLLRSSPEERSSQPLGGGSVISRIIRVVSDLWTERDEEAVSRGIIWGNVLVLETNKMSVKMRVFSARDMNLIPPEYDAVPLWRHADCKCYVFKHYCFSFRVSPFTTCFMLFILPHTCNPSPHVERFRTCWTLPLLCNALPRWYTILLFQTDAHNYKIIGILKQLKFRLSLRHVSVHAGTIFRELCAVHGGGSSFLHRVQHTCTTGWYAAMTLITSVTTST